MMKSNAQNAERSLKRQTDNCSMLIKVKLSIRGEGRAAHVIAGLKRLPYSPLWQCHEGTLNVNFPGAFKIQSLDLKIGNHGLVNVKISKTGTDPWINGFIFVPQFTRHVDPSFAELVFPSAEWVSEKPESIFIDIDVCNKSGDSFLIKNRAVLCNRNINEAGCSLSAA